MYIEPNSTIKIFKNVPLDNTYNHTIWFPSLEAQTIYFNQGSITKFTLGAQSYQRVVKGKMRIEKPADDLYDCNYLAFRNNTFGNKWFYAFITSVEYVNNITSEITFEIDDIQTYMFNVTIKKCFVEREHSETDEIGDNIQAEPVALGEYINSDYRKLEGLSDMLVLVMIADEDSVDIGNLYDGVFGGCDIFAYLSTDVSSIKAKINSYIQKPDQIISIYMCPKVLIPNVGVGGRALTYGQSGSPKSYADIKSVYETSQTFGDYEPKNKKLYTYPYNFLRVDNASGQSLNLRYEFFKDFRPVLEIRGCITPPVRLVARPCNYKGLPSYSELGGYTPSKSESITLENYPVCSWNVDSFSNWLAQNSVPIALNTLGGTGVSSLASNAFNPISLIEKFYVASIAADECRGNVSTGNVNVANDMQAFYIQRCHVTENYAQVIDDFFSVYGYATNRVKTPNTHARLRWTYTKTNGCVAVGSAPADAIKHICQIYDKGITFWANIADMDVGNYDKDNPTIS